MSKAERQVSESSTSKERKLSAKQTGGLLMAGMAVFAALGSGCSAKSADNTPPKPKQTAEAVQGSEQKAELSASEQQYAEYLKTLSPEQVELRESLNPDALAEMSEAELTAAFTIRADEVLVDGKLDPELYAEAFTARFQAMSNSGISDKEYSKWGGLDNFGTDKIEEVADNYFSVQSSALFGYVGNDKILQVSLTNGSIIDQTIKSGQKPQPQERYHLRVVVRPDSISNFAENKNGTYDIQFGVHMSDNWDTDTMLQLDGINVDPTDANFTWSMTRIRITDDGKVLPEKLQL